MKPAEEPSQIITDGAYGSAENHKLAEDKNITLTTTGLLGRKTRDILLDFELFDDGRTVVKCPKGNTPKSSTYSRRTNTIRKSFERCQCENCEHRAECLIKLKKRTAVLFLSPDARKRAQEYKDSKNDESLKIAGRIRNGIETVPSTLRRRYHVDRMPVRGKLKTKQFFSFKLYALNFCKLVRFTRGLEKCRTLVPENA